MLPGCEDLMGSLIHFFFVFAFEHLNLLYDMTINILHFESWLLGMIFDFLVLFCVVKHKHGFL